MNSTTVKRQDLLNAVNTLPETALPELASFLDYLQYKVAQRSLVSTKLPATETRDHAQAQTPLGQRLRGLRQKIVASGAPLLDREAIAAELAESRNRV
ncbi:MAG: hypothetical protein AAGG51_24730 [Cyanobacteria bacterium P01_G01_bin.54]